MIREDEDELFIFDGRALTQAIVGNVGIDTYKKIVEHYWYLIEFEYGITKEFKDASEE